MSISTEAIILISKLDIAGMNMRQHLMNNYDYREVEFIPPENWPKGSYELHMNDNNSILCIPEDQIFADYVQDVLDCKVVIFASKHSAKSGMKALLTHTTGIFGNATEFGGNDNQLAFAPSKLLYMAYKKITELSLERELNEYWTGIEVTHHGPTNYTVPVLFMEVGGTELEWRDISACSLIADVIYYITTKISEGFENYEKVTYIGIGGTHYASRYIKFLERDEYYMGHIIPKYAHETSPDTIIDEMYEKTIGDEKIFLIDRKGTKSVHRKRFIERIEKLGYKWKLVGTK